MTLTLHTISEIEIAKSLDDFEQRTPSLPALNHRAIAFSGGGDSMALLVLLCKKYTQSKQTLRAFIVDHGLQESSRKITKMAAKRARILGAEVHILTWKGLKPQKGLQENARAARYALLAQACHRHKVTHLYLAHTEDDNIETIYMRAQKPSKTNAQALWGLAGISAYQEAPLWPALHNIYLCRPLLAMNRADLRHWLDTHTYPYHDDDANTNTRYERVRARALLASNQYEYDKYKNIGKQTAKKRVKMCEDLQNFTRAHLRFTNWGGVYIAQDPFKACTRAVQERLLATILLAVSGQNQPVSWHKITRLRTHLLQNSKQAVTLGGTQISNTSTQTPAGVKQEFLCVCDTGMVLGRYNKPVCAPLQLAPYQEVIWGGRFHIKAPNQTLHIYPLGLRLSLGKAPVNANPISNILKRRPDTIPYRAWQTLPFGRTKTGEDIAPSVLIIHQSSSKKGALITPMPASILSTDAVIQRRLQSLHNFMPSFACVSQNINKK